MTKRLRYQRARLTAFLAVLALISVAVFFFVKGQAHTDHFIFLGGTRPYGVILDTVNYGEFAGKIAEERSHIIQADRKTIVSVISKELSKKGYSLYKQDKLEFEWRTMDSASIVNLTLPSTTKHSNVDQITTATVQCANIMSDNLLTTFRIFLRSHRI